jgi:hypothetical protein
MKNNYDSLYHLQIAKCGGTYLNNMVINKISKILKNNKINFINGEHHMGWQEGNNIYKISCFRDPVKRLVSHYTFHKKDYVNNSSLMNVNNFIAWVEDNEEFISNYQIKNFLYTNQDLSLNIFNPESNNLVDPNFLSININKGLAIKRIKNVNILLKDNQLNEKTCFLIGNKILRDFSIDFNFFIDKDKSYNHNITEQSLIIFKNLNKKTIQNLYSINNLDSEIYFSDSIYYNDR